MACIHPPQYYCHPLPKQAEDRDTRTDRQTDRQTYRQAGRQTDIQTYRQTHRQSPVYKHRKLFKTIDDLIIIIL